MDGSQRAEQMAERDEERAPCLAMLPQPKQRRRGARKAGDDSIKERGEHGRNVSARGYFVFAVLSGGGDFGASGSFCG